MRADLVKTDPRTWLLVFDTGEELAEGLQVFADREEIVGATISAVGAFSSIELVWFDWESTSYQPSVCLNEQVELVSLLGDIASEDGRPAVHAHVGIARRDGTMHGGHLRSATVRPTCEVIITESEERWRKEIDPQSGLALIRGIDRF